MVAFIKLPELDGKGACPGEGGYREENEAPTLLPHLLPEGAEKFEVGTDSPSHTSPRPWPLISSGICSLPSSNQRPSQPSSFLLLLILNTKHCLNLLPQTRGVPPTCKHTWNDYGASVY